MQDQIQFNMLKFTNHGLPTLRLFIQGLFKDFSRTFARLINNIQGLVFFWNTNYVAILHIFYTKANNLYQQV